MAFDAHKNFAVSTIATAPAPASSGTSLIVATGDGTKFPATPFNATVWPAAPALPTVANAEIVRIVTMVGDSATVITRQQEGSSARSIVIGDQIAAGVTVKTLTDIEGSLDIANVCDVRLTLTQSLPVTVADVTGATSVWAASYKGCKVGLNPTGVSGAWTAYAIPNPAGGLQLALGTLVNGQAYDVYAYLSGGVVTLGMQEWCNIAGITVTIATPGVVTWNAHGLATGNSMTFTTSGALPTGLAANVVYWVTVVDVNTFKLSTTPANVAAGTFIATSGTQSGTHTGHHPQALFPTNLTYIKTRPTLDGVIVMTTDGSTIDGTKRYLGTFQATSTTTTEDSVAKRLLWNYYNRARRVVRRFETTASWPYTLATVRQANANVANQIQLIVGVPESILDLGLIVSGSSSGTGYAVPGIGENSVSTFSASAICGATQSAAANALAAATVKMCVAPVLGANFYSWNEWAQAVNVFTWWAQGWGPAATQNSGLEGTWEN